MFDPADPFVAEWDKLPRVLVNQVMRHTTPFEFCALLVVLRKTHGHNKCEDAISASQLALFMGLPRATAWDAMKGLMKKGLVEVCSRKGKGPGNLYRVSWRGVDNITKKSGKPDLWDEESSGYPDGSSGYPDGSSGYPDGIVRLAGIQGEQGDKEEQQTRTAGLPAVATRAPEGAPGVAIAPAVKEVASQSLKATRQGKSPETHSLGGRCGFQHAERASSPETPAKPHQSSPTDESATDELERVGMTRQTAAEYVQKFGAPAVVAAVRKARKRQQTAPVSNLAGLAVRILRDTPGAPVSPVEKPTEEQPVGLTAAQKSEAALWRSRLDVETYERLHREASRRSAGLTSGRLHDTQSLIIAYEWMQEDVAHV